MVTRNQKVTLLMGGFSRNAPSGVELLDADDSGTSSTDNITSVVSNVRFPITGLSAVAKAGDQVELGGLPGGSNIGDIAGDTVTITVAGPIAAGTYTPWARVTSHGRKVFGAPVTFYPNGPAIQSLTFTSTPASNQTYGAGETVSVAIAWDHAPTVTGTPQLTLNIGGTNRTANYASGSGTTSLVFSYTIQAADNDANGISIASNSLALNSGTIGDAAGNSATLTHSAVADQSGQKVAGGGAGPVLSSQTLTATGSTTASATVSTTGTNGTLYGVVTTSSTTPSAAQVKTGKDNTGAAATATIGSGSGQAVSGSGVQTVSGGFTGLTAATTYYVHFMHEDGSANQSSVVSSSSIETFQTETQTLLTAMVVQPTTARAANINTFIKAQKTAGTWTKKTRLHVHRAHTQQAGLLDWKNPGSGPAVNTSSMTFTTDVGFTSNGTSSFLALGVTYNSGSLVQDSAHLAGSVSGTLADTLTAQILGRADGNGRFALAVNRSGSAYNVLPRMATAAAVTGANAGAIAGYFVSTRTGASAGKHYFNGSSIGTYTTASEGVGTGNAQVAQSNTLFSPNTVIHEMEHFGVQLSDADVAADAAAWSAYVAGL